MREFLDAILEEIGSESLTDLEFDGIDLPMPPEYTAASYEALKLVIQNREDVSGQGRRLKLYYLARGVDLSSAPPVHVPNSNILIGGEL